MTQDWLRFAVAQYYIIAMASIGTVFLTGAILPHYRDHLKRQGRKVFNVKYWPFKFSDRIDTLGYTIAFWYFSNDSLPYNLLLTAWRFGYYGAIASFVLAILVNK
jgi:hypothetical protein